MAAPEVDYTVEDTLSSWIHQHGGVVDGVELRYTPGSDGSVSRQLTITRDTKVRCALDALLPPGLMHTLGAAAASPAAAPSPAAACRCSVSGSPSDAALGTAGISRISTARIRPASPEGRCDALAQPVLKAVRRQQ